MPKGLPPKAFEWNFCATCGSTLVRAHDGEQHQPYCSLCDRFFYRNPVPACCLFITDDQNRLLFGRRDVEPCRGRWALPGGFMELLESAEECALREMEEETGLKGLEPALLGSCCSKSPDNGAVLILGFVVKNWSGILTPGSDVRELAFFHRHERPDIPFDAHRALLDIYDTLYL